MEVTVLNKDGKDTGRKVALNEAIFGVEPNDHCIYLDVKQYLANSRQGTHKTKERAEISGSTRKIKRQKGTGTARAGSIKSPVFRGGGRVFGPTPRDYSFKLNKKVKRIARLSALSNKAKEEGIVILDELSLNSPKTKAIVDLQKNLDLSDKKLLIILSEQNKNVYLSSRNLRGVAVVTVSDLATYDIMKASKLLFVEDSLNKLNEIYNQN